MGTSGGSKTMSMLFLKRTLISRMLLPLLLLGVLLGFTGNVTAQPAPVKQDDDSLAVMQKFNEMTEDQGGVYKVEDKRKHQILFVMGVSLLILIGLTAYFGLAMGIGGKNVFVPHMVCAGLTVTLAVAHAVTAIVWFFPF